MPTYDLAATPLRDLNQALHAVAPGDNDRQFSVVNPRGHHAVAVGVHAPVTIDVMGSVGYYCGSMNDEATNVPEASGSISALCIPSGANSARRGHEG